MKTKSKVSSQVSGYTNAQSTMTHYGTAARNDNDKYSVKKDRNSVFQRSLMHSRRNLQQLEPVKGAKRARNFGMMTTGMGTVFRTQNASLEVSKMNLTRKKHAAPQQVRHYLFDKSSQYDCGSNSQRSN